MPKLTKRTLPTWTDGRTHPKCRKTSFLINVEKVRFLKVAKTLILKRNKVTLVYYCLKIFS